MHETKLIEMTHRCIVLQCFLVLASSAAAVSQVAQGVALRTQVTGHANHLQSLCVWGGGGGGGGRPLKIHAPSRKGYLAVTEHCLWILSGHFVTRSQIPVCSCLLLAECYECMHFNPWESQNIPESTDLHISVLLYDLQVLLEVSDSSL